MNYTRKPKKNARNRTFIFNNGSYYMETIDNSNFEKLKNLNNNFRMQETYIPKQPIIKSKNWNNPDQNTVESYHRPSLVSHSINPNSDLQYNQNGMPETTQYRPSINENFQQENQFQRISNGYQYQTNKFENIQNNRSFPKQQDSHNQYFYINQPKQSPFKNRVQEYPFQVSHQQPQTNNKQQPQGRENKTRFLDRTFLTMKEDRNIVRGNRPNPTGNMQQIPSKMINSMVYKQNSNTPVYNQNYTPTRFEDSAQAYNKNTLREVHPTETPHILSNRQFSTPGNFKKPQIDSYYHRVDLNQINAEHNQRNVEHDQRNLDPKQRNFEHDQSNIDLKQRNVEHNQRNTRGHQQKTWPKTMPNTNIFHQNQMKIQSRNSESKNQQLSTDFFKINQIATDQTIQNRNIQYSQQFNRNQSNNTQPNVIQEALGTTNKGDYIRNFAPFQNFSHQQHILDRNNQQDPHERTSITDLTNNLLNGKNFSMSLENISNQKYCSPQKMTQNQFSAKFDFSTQQSGFNHMQIDEQNNISLLHSQNNNTVKSGENINYQLLKNLQSGKILQNKKKITSVFTPIRNDQFNLIGSQKPEMQISHSQTKFKIQIKNSNKAVRKANESQIFELESYFNTLFYARDENTISSMFTKILTVDIQDDSSLTEDIISERKNQIRKLIKDSSESFIAYDEKIAKDLAFSKIKKISEEIEKHTSKPYFLEFFIKFINRLSDYVKKELEDNGHTVDICYGLIFNDMLKKFGNKLKKDKNFCIQIKRTDFKK